MTADLRDLDVLAHRVATVDGRAARDRVQQELVAPALRQHHQRFARRVEPDGGRWPPRKDSKPHPLLEETGRMRRSLRASPDAGVVVSATRPVGLVDVAAVHQHGSERVPQRRFLGFGGEDLRDLADVAADRTARFIGEEL